jgi:hypothetical protein
MFEVRRTTATVRVLKVRFQTSLLPPVITAIGTKPPARGVVERPLPGSSDRSL